MMNPKHGNRKKVMYVQYRLELTLSDKSQACFLGRFRQGGANHIGCWGVGTNLCRCGCSGPIFASDTWGAWILRKLILLSVSVAPSEQATYCLISLKNYRHLRRMRLILFPIMFDIGSFENAYLDNMSVLVG